MKSISAGLVAAGVAFIINKRLSKGFSTTRIVVITPFVEETMKTVASIMFGANVLVTHMTFGIAEAARDIASGGPGAYAALISVLVHTLCGYIHWWVEKLKFSDFVGFVFAVAFHLGWNGLVVYNSKRQNRV